MAFEESSNVKSKRCFSQTSHLFSYSEDAEHMFVRDVAAGANPSGFDQARSANASELKLSEESLPYLNSSLDADIEMYNKKRMGICCTGLDESKKEADTLGRACDNTHSNCGVCDDCRQSHSGEDSQLEYISAQEQDFDDRNSSCEFSEQREIIGIETLKLTDPIHEVSGGGVAEEKNFIDVSEGCCPASKCGTGDQTYPEAAIPELPHLLQDSLSLPDCNVMTSDRQEEQTEYHSVLCGSIQESHFCGSKEKVCPNLLVCDSLENRKVKDIPLMDSMLPSKMATSEEVSGKNDRHIRRVSVKQDNLLLSRGARAPAVAVQFCESAEDSSFYSCEESGVCARGASCTAKDAETQFPLSEILTSKDPVFGEEVADKSSGGNTSSLNSQLEHRETLRSVASVSTVNQAVDASSDFRACFTTSRSTSAQVCLSSRAINTEITMMNKSRPVEWHRETCADVACNTDWSCGAVVGSTDKMCSQLTDTLEKHSGANTATAERMFILGLVLLRLHLERLVHLDKQAVKSSASSDCQKILQRAIEAELQILNAHYQMCYQHCLKIYKLALEENTCFSRCNGNAELGSSLMLVLEELKKNYNTMRMKIKTGVPLNALPPLSVEMKLFQISSSYVPLFFYSCWWPKFLSVRGMPVLIYIVVLMTCLFSEFFHTMYLQPKCASKYQISDILSCVDSDNHRYAFLCFKETNKAKLAVEEMDQKKINGKTISVELVNNSSENKSLVSQMLTNKIWHEIQPVDNGQRNDQDKLLTSASNSVKAPDDTGENFLPKTSAPFSTNSYDAFISPHALNLSSFTKLMKKLQEIHPEASRDRIVDALLEVRKNNKGILSGLSINSIVKRTSVILKKSTPSCGWEKQCK
uniref:TTC3/DZIP3/RBM44-like helical domain-containing protein n=1 Tax=Calidris pygmaea TaxID=425635 RepID=A0A8C3JFG7_9CHAR